MTLPRRLIEPVVIGLLVGLPVLLLAVRALGHNLADSNARFVEALSGIAPAPFMYLGARHMVTGIDHLLYLAGVIFFLCRPRDILLFVSLFTLGHSLTLLGGVLLDVRVDERMIDAIIGLSIVWKAFENIGGFRALQVAPDPHAAVFVFGLFHGLGLAGRLQTVALSDDGLVANLVAFNIGVELGQFTALALLLLALHAWRRQAAFGRSALAVNTALMGIGFLLAARQFAFWLLQPSFT